MKQLVERVYGPQTGWSSGWAVLGEGFGGVGTGRDAPSPKSCAPNQLDFAG